MNKKILSAVLFLFIALSLASYAEMNKELQAKIDFYQAKITKVNSYIKTLETKATGTRGKDLDKINKEIKKQYQRIEQLKAMMDAETGTYAEIGIVPVMQPKAPAEAPQPKPTLAAKGLIGEAGYAAGAGAVGLSYVMPIKQNMAVRPGAQYLIGKNYSVMLLQAIGDYYLNPETRVGASIDYASYSEKVKSIPGIGETAKGGNLGFGLIAAKKLGKYEVQFGYSTVLGIVLLGGYCF